MIIERDLFMKEDITYECKLSSNLTRGERIVLLVYLIGFLILTIIWIGLIGNIWTISMAIHI